MIRNHVLLKSDYPKVVQLQYMRANFHDPSIVNHNFTLQFQIRPIASNNKTDSHAPSLSYQSNMKGNAPSRSNIQIERTYQSWLHADRRKHIVEKLPPVQLFWGMCSKIINYHHGDKKRCSVLAGGTMSVSFHEYDYGKFGTDRHQSEIRRDCKYFLDAWTSATINWAFFLFLQRR